MPAKMMKSCLLLLFAAAVFLSPEVCGQWAKSPESVSLTRTTALSNDNAGNVYSAGLMTCNTIFDMDTLFNNSCGQDTLIPPVINQLDIFLASHDENGDLNWANKFTGVPENRVFVHAMESDDAGNNYIVGEFIDDLNINGPVLINNDTTSDGFLVRVLQDGTTDWGLKIGATDSSLIAIHDVTIDNSSIYVSGQFRGRIDVGVENDSVKYKSAFLASYDLAGNPQWLRTLPPVETTSESIGQAVSVGAGELFMLVNFRDSVAITVTDTLVPPGMLTRASAVLRYLPDGTFVSYKVLNTTGLQDLEFADPALYVTGTYTNDFAVGVDTVINDTGTKAFLLQLNAALVPQWVLPINSDNTTTLDGNSISVNDVGNVFVAGTHSGSFVAAGPLNTSGDNTISGFLLKVDAAGTPSWLQTVGGTGPDETLVVSARDENTIYCGGYYQNFIRFAGDELLNDTDVSNGFIARVDVCPEVMVDINGQRVNYACAGDSFTFSSTNDPSYTYKWFKDGVLLPGEDNFNYVADTLGLYNVEITAPTCTKLTPLRELQLNVLPDTTLTVNKSLLQCIGDSITLTGPSSTFDFQWLESGIPTGIGDTLQALKVGADGDYALRITTDSLCTLTSFERQIRFLDYPDSSLNLAGRQVICDGDNVFLQAEDDPTFTYKWIMDEDTIPSATSSSFLATESGIYTAFIENEAGCTSLTLPDTVVVQQAPIIDLNDEVIGPILCQGESVIISTPFVSTQNYEWRRNGMAIMGEISNTITVSEGGSYRVYVTNSTCDALSDPVDLTEVAPPVSQIISISELSFCEGSESVLEANDGAGLTYQWLRNDAEIDGETDRFITINDGGRYTVEVFNSSGCSQVSSPEQITIKFAPPSEITVNKTTICEGENTELIGNDGTNLSYRWFRDGVELPGAADRIYVADVSGDYTLEVTNSSFCSALSSSQPVNVITIPVADISSALPNICQGDSLELRAPVDATYSYNWLFNGNLVPGEMDNSFYAQAIGDYQSIVYVEDCRDTSVVLTLTIRTNPKPDITRNDDFLSTSLFGDILWFADNEPIPDSDDQNIRVLEDGYYKVQVINTNGCTAVSDSIAMCLPVPEITRVNDVLTVNEAGQQYEWYFKGTPIGGATNQNLTAQQSGEYSVIMTFEDGCAMESFPVTVCIPYSFITRDDETGVLFANPPVAQAYQWYYDSIPLSQEDLNVFIPDSSGIYRVEVTDFEGCTSISEGFAVDKITGLPEAHYGISVYPNPVHDKLYISMPDGQRADAIIYNMSGSRLVETSLTGTANIDLRTFSSGTYFLQLLIGDERVMVKLQRE